MTQIKFWFFISTLSIAFSNDGEGYRFIGNSTQDYYQDLESIFEMSFGPWDFLMNYSGRQTHEFVAPKENLDEIVSKFSSDSTKFIICFTCISGDKLSK